MNVDERVLEAIRRETSRSNENLMKRKLFRISKPSQGKCFALPFFALPTIHRAYSARSIQILGFIVEGNSLWELSDVEVSSKMQNSITA